MDRHMLAAANARLRAVWRALTRPAVTAPAYVALEPYQIAPHMAADVVDLDAVGPCAIPAPDPVLRALTVKPCATVQDWREWYEGHGYGDIPVTHSQIDDIRAMIRRDLECVDIQDADLYGATGMFRPVHRGMHDRDTRYRYRPIGAEDLEDPADLRVLDRKLLAFLRTRARPVSGKIAAKALGVHHSNISRAKDRLIANALITQEQVGKEILFGVPRQSRGASRRVA